MISMCSVSAAVLMVVFNQLLWLFRFILVMNSEELVVIYIVNYNFVGGEDRGICGCAVNDLLI